MIGYLIKRPIAVFTISIAIIFLGIIAAIRMPTSLMPDIDIPEISIQINYPNHSAREIENNIVRPLRDNLLQVTHLNNIESESKDENASIKLSFDYGTRIHYAFIETNEKIDAAQNYLPKDLPRPVVIKASATDIPVLNLIITPEEPDENKFLQLGSFARQVLKKRIEQLPEVGIADISGAPLAEITVSPKTKLLQQTGITPEMIVNTLKNNNIESGNFIIQNGIYQYKFKFDNSLTDINDIKNLHLYHNGKIYRIGDLCLINQQARKAMGQVEYNGKKSIIFSVIKQKDAQISDLKKKLYELITELKNDYPELNFTIINDQSKILEISISNLLTSLLLGTFLAIFILFFFIRNYKFPLIIAVSIPSSLLISLLFLYIFDVSINIISLSGLVLGVGLIIDNAIIVIDNIIQKTQNKDLFDAVTIGTVEIISPLISSALTTISVFIPLIFISGIAGALFYDQAISISVGLLTSILVSVVFIPVIFYALTKKSGFYLKKENNGLSFYNKSYQYFYRHNKMVLAVALSGIILLGLLFLLPRQKLPDLTQTDTLVYIDWNEPVSLKENQKRIDSLIKIFPEIKQYISYTGKQDFVLKKHNQQDPNQSVIYVNAVSNTDLLHFKKTLSNILPPKTKVEYQPADNVFNYIFGNNKDEKSYKIYPKNQTQLPDLKNFVEFNEKYRLNLNIPLQPVLQIKILQDRLLLYDISYDRLTARLKTVFHQNFIDRLENEKEFIPIQLSYNTTDIFKSLQELKLTNRKGEQIPVNQLIKIRKTQQYKSITADRKGEYILFKTNNINQSILDDINQNSDFYIDAPNSFSKNTGKELWYSIFISLILLYLIMAAQFESFWQPLIILLEIPIDIGFALLFLYLFGSSINIMSLIGIVVMSGIVVNDSILKIHTINLLHKQGLDIEDAIHQAGKLRLKPILMTSLTTILALLPFLFMSGLGAELQKPLALVIIGGLLFGTFVSLFFIPLAYRYIMRLSNKS